MKAELEIGEHYRLHTKKTKSNLMPYIIYFQFISAVLAMLLLIKQKQSVFLFFLTLSLWITVGVEVLGTILLKMEKSSFLYHHLYALVLFLMVFLMYRSQIIDKKGLRVSVLLLIMFFVFWVLIFFDSNYFPYAQIVGSINVGLLVFLYFKELLLSNEIIDYKKQLPFWVSIGFAVFYLGSIPFFALWNYFKTDGRGLFYILHVLIVLMNVFISIGLIIKLLENKKVDKNNIEIDSY